MLNQVGYTQPGQAFEPLDGSTSIETLIDFNNSNQDPCLKYTFNDSDWYYIAFTKTISDDGMLFVNGEPVGDINWDDLSYDHFVLNFGASYFLSYTGYFSGSIDEIRISNEIKSQSEIKAHFDSDQSFFTEPNTAIIWKFDEGSGTQFTNEGGDKTGSLYGNPAWIDGKFGKAVQYDGVDDRGRITVDLVEYGVTYEFWVKFDGEIRETSQTVIQPYGSTSSIELQIQQTAIEPEPPVNEVIVAGLTDVPVSCTSIFLKAGIKIEIDLDATTISGPYEALVSPSTHLDEGVVYQIPDNGVRTILGLDKGNYNVQIYSISDKESYTYSEDIPVFGGPFPLEFEIVAKDSTVECVGDVGSITIGNISGDPDTTFVIQLLDERNVILETYERSVDELTDGFTIGEANTEKLVAGRYYVKVIQNQNDCAGVEATSEIVTIHQGSCLPPESEVIFSMAETTALSGQEVSIPVSVEGFENILTMQYTIEWDPAVLQFVQVQDFNLKDLDENSFNLFEPGKLTCSWTPADLQAVEVNDQTEIFNIVFEVICMEGATSLLQFSDDPTAREVADGESNILTVVYSNGSVTVLDEVQLVGYIQTQKGEALANVELLLSGGKDETALTDEYGRYSFSVTPGLDYTITTNYHGRVLPDAGVTTLDLVVMQWHILGMKFLMSNYDLIASDVNNSGSLTTLDVAQTRAVILHIDDTFEGRDAIEFVSYDYTGNPDKFNYPNTISITPNESLSDLNFTVVKLGDASRSWAVNQSSGRNQDLERLEFRLEKGISSKKHLDLALKANDFNNIIGLQFTLEWDPGAIRIVGLKDDHLSFDTNLNMIEQGKMSIVWSSDKKNGLTLDGEDILSSFEFETISKADPRLSINSAITPALAYNSDLTSFRISSTSLNNDLHHTQISLYPNPAHEVLRIKGDLPGQSHYSILDATGKVLGKGLLGGQIEVGQLKRGVYLLRIERDDNQIINKKFLKF